MHLLIVLAAFAITGLAPFMSPQPPNNSSETPLDEDAAAAPGDEDDN